jgi:hypothetical protein
MTDKLNSAIVREMIEMGSQDPIAFVLGSYMEAALSAALFESFIVHIQERKAQLCGLLSTPPTDMGLTPQFFQLITEVSHQLHIVYRLAIFDSFLNNLTTYALAARPAKAVGHAQMQVSILLAKTRADAINDHIEKRTKSLSRENFGSRIQALREICEIDLSLDKDDVAELKRLSDLRNAIVHEGSAFTVDDNLRINPRAETQKIKVPSLENFPATDRLAASIYEQYVTSFLDRKLQTVEQVVLSALKGNVPAVVELGREALPTLSR